MGMRSAERKKVIFLGMRCLRSLAGVSRMDRVIIFIIKKGQQSKAWRE